MKQNITKEVSKTTSKNRGAAIRAQRRNQDDAANALVQFASANEKLGSRRANTVLNSFDKLKITFLGGLEDVGEKNMAVIEYKNEAIILDCGISLGINLPGINYTVNDITYLESIKHKIKAYVITHGHLDHMGGLRHTVPKFPAPIYGSRYTIGIVKKSFEDLAVDTGLQFNPEVITTELDSHQKYKIGSFLIEFIRVTHALPDAAAILLETPVGRIIATGDFRLIPEPLDKMPTDTKRLKELGDKGVLLLLSESSYSEVEGRVPTESTLQQSFYDIIENATGRIFVALFSSNMNRIQMIINAAIVADRKIALDGRGMLSYAEIAVRQGILKIPKGTVVPIQEAGNISPDKLLVMCTGGQGEPNASLQRMSQGEHKFVNLNAGDTVIISSSPIPGNEVSYEQLGNRLKKKGVHLFRHPTHQIDGCGPLHVSGHGRREELRDMINLVRPKFFIPVHGGTIRRGYHAEIAIEENIPRMNIMLLENGDSIYLSPSSMEQGEQVPNGSLLVDQNGTVVGSMVVKDRLMLGEQGIITAILTVDKKSGKLIASPDIISRGFVVLSENKDLMNDLRSEIFLAVNQRFKRIDKDRFKNEIKDHVSQFAYNKTGHSPIVIVVVNVLNSHGQTLDRAPVKSKPPELVRQSNEIRFKDLRTRLLSSKS